MPIYTGKTEDGSDIEEVAGLYVNPDNENEWSNTPYLAQKRPISMYNEVIDYMSGKYSLNDVYNQIKAKTCKLPFSLRKYVLSHYDNKGNFIVNN